MQDIMIELYLKQEKDNKNPILDCIRNFYKNSTGQLSILIFLANPTEQSSQSSPRYTQLFKLQGIDNSSI